MVGTDTAPTGEEQDHASTHWQQERPSLTVHPQYHRVAGD
jgi:hypothetical protein